MSDVEELVSDEDIHFKTSKKKRKKQSSQDREINKKRRYSGESFTSTKGKVPSKNFTLILNCCKQSCGVEVCANDQENLFNSFYSCNKEQQDTMFAGCLTAKSASTHCVNAQKHRDIQWKYAVKCNGTPINVCRQFLLNLYQISEKRLRIIQGKVLSGSTFTEKRGSHTNRPNKIEEEVWVLAREHLALFPSRHSHYAREKTSKEYFENPNLSPKKLYDLFLQYYKNEKGVNLKLSYKTYHRFFLHKTNYAFRLPRTDMCNFCSECQVKLKSNPTDECKVRFEMHQRKYRAFKAIKDELLQHCKNEDSRIIVLEFDYAQNLPLPKTNENSQFYKRLLWTYLFNVHCHNDGSSILYYYLETE